jgi:condensin complex subunit 1
MVHHSGTRHLYIVSMFICLINFELMSFRRCITRPAYHVSESEQYMKSQPIKLGIYKVICLAVKHHGHALAAQISIMQSLQYYEHLSEPMADCLTILAKEFDHAQLGDEILREIASKSFSGQDSKGPRAFSKFLVRFAETAPRAVLKQISLLLAHLDSEVSKPRIPKGIFD